MHCLLLRLFPFAAMVWGCLASLGAAAELTLEENPENVVASRLAGDWQVSAELTKRLTGSERAFSKTLSFKSDPSILAKVPPKHAEAIAKLGAKVYLAGLVNFREKDLPFLLTSVNGNPHLVFWLERDGERFGNVESMNVMLAVADPKQNDLLFLGGDFNNQPFLAYERATTKSPE